MSHGSIARFTCLAAAVLLASIDAAMGQSAPGYPPGAYPPSGYPPAASAPGAYRGGYAPPSAVPGMGPRRPMTLYGDSWTAERAPEPKQIRAHDIITIVVDEQSVVISEGEMDRKKKAYADLVLKDWILLKGLAAVPDPQSAGEPEIAANLDNKLRSEASLETRDSIKFRIACTVVDIRPNGNLILEGLRQVKNNNESWEYALTGEIRAEDVLPNNTVLSENVANLRIDKREAGHVRDGYRRGWLLQWLDRWQPF